MSVTPEAEIDVTFMTAKFTHLGVVHNERYFIGRMPRPGEAVELVYIGDNEQNEMRFQLRVRSP